MRRFIPTPSQRKGQKKKGRKGSNQTERNMRKVLLHQEEINEEWLNRFSGRIFFWSFSFVKVRPDTLATKFRVYTKRLISKRKLFDAIEGAFPEGCSVEPCWKYRWRHTFDIKTTAPMRWDAFIWRVCKALEELV